MQENCFCIYSSIRIDAYIYVCSVSECLGWVNGTQQWKQCEMARKTISNVCVLCVDVKDGICYMVYTVLMGAIRFRSYRCYAQVVFCVCVFSAPSLLFFLGFLFHSHSSGVYEPNRTVVFCCCCCCREKPCWKHIENVNVYAMLYKHLIALININVCWGRREINGCPIKANNWERLLAAHSENSDNGQQQQQQQRKKKQQ